MAFVVLEKAQVSSWTVTDGMVTIVADGFVEVGAWDPQDCVTYSVTGARCEIDLDWFETMPTSAEEVAEALDPDTEWWVETDRD